MLLLALQEAGWGVVQHGQVCGAAEAHLARLESDLERQFLSWVNRLILPQLKHEMLERLPLANWQTTVAGAPHAQHMWQLPAEFPKWLEQDVQAGAVCKSCSCPCHG